MNAPQPLQASDFAAVARLLTGNQLQVSDIAPEHLTHFLGIKTDQEIVAVGGIEIHGQSALLRSVAVAPDCQGSGYGVQIVKALEDYAQPLGIDALYLLTETADAFFERLRYQSIARIDAPADIRATSQFSDLCPDSAVCMVKHLRK